MNIYFFVFEWTETFAFERRTSKETFWFWLAEDCYNKTKKKKVYDDWQQQRSYVTCKVTTVNWDFLPLWGRFAFRDKLKQTRQKLSDGGNSDRKL